MFEFCNSMQELNQLRGEKARGGFPLEEINSDYNKRKKELMSMAAPYTKINIHRAPSEDIVPVMYIPYVGASSKKNTIQLTETGFLC